MKLTHPLKLIRNGFIACSLMLASQAVQAGVPVIDGSHITANIEAQAANTAKQIAEWAKNLEQWKTSFQNWKQQYDALMSGNIMSIFGGLTNTGEKAGDSNVGDGYGQDSANSLMPNKNPCGSSKAGASYNACISARNMQAQGLAEMKSLMKNVNKRSDEINELLNEGKGSKTPGEMQALQFRMSGLQAMLQNDISRLQMSMSVHKQRMEMFKQQQSEESHRALHGNGQPVGLAF